jgi:5-methylcytosine-specific restriction endonuclease McrA
MKYPRLEDEKEEDFLKRRKKEICAEYRRKHKERVRLSRKSWECKNPEYFSEHFRKNKQTKLKQVSEYKKNNKDKIRYSNALRAKKIKTATPVWADLEKIRVIYREALKKEILTGITHHVDHIIPLRGKTVCGLHIPENLQILTEEQNLKKGNRLLL